MPGANELNTQVYVVEVPGVEPGTRLPYHSYDTVKGCCAYDAESPVHAGIKWETIDDPTEDHAEAIRLAKRYPRARVRRYWVAKVVEQKPLPNPKAPMVVPTTLIDLTCMDHPEEKVRWLPDGTHPPKCHLCQKPLVTQALIDAMSNPVDLKDI